jgi:5,6-dimethylbenzimidazole synthase
VTSADYNNRNNNYHESHSFASPHSSSIFSTHEKEGLYKAIFLRRDVRSQFITDKPIPDDVLFRILNAAHHAPSVGYSQPWNFIVIKDRSLRRQVKESFLLEHRKSISMLEDSDDGNNLRFENEKSRIVIV